MSKINIAVLGTIGVGKTTLIKNFAELGKNDNLTVEIMKEPSVSMENVNRALEHLYKDGDNWIYPLQLGITAGHELEFEELKGKDYDILLSDMPYSSFIYGKIHLASGRINEEEFKNLIAGYRHFPFDYVFILKASEAQTINQVRDRNKKISKNEIKDQLDSEIQDFSYLKDHIKNFNNYFEEYLDGYFKNAKRIIIDVENLNSEEGKKSYWRKLNEIYKSVRA